MSEPFLLYRAHSSKYLRGVSGEIENPNIARTRRPRDTPGKIHEFLKGWFSERFGVDYRGQALFCTGDYSIAKGYKTPDNQIISLAPVGPFSICYSPVCKDLFGHYQFQWSLADNPIERIEQEIEGLGFIEYRNEGLEIAAASGNEVMVFAQKFNYKISGVV